MIKFCYRQQNSNYNYNANFLPVRYLHNVLFSSPFFSGQSSMANFFTKKGSNSTEETSAQSGAHYNPGKARYHPINDAFWKEGKRSVMIACNATVSLF